jgi:hypothetical protein
MTHLVQGQFKTPGQSSPVREQSHPFITPHSATFPICAIIHKWTEEILKEVNKKLAEDIEHYTQQYSHHELSMGQEGPLQGPLLQGTVRDPVPVNTDSPIPRNEHSEGKNRVDIRGPHIPRKPPGDHPSQSTGNNQQAKTLLTNTLLSHPDLKALQDLSISLFTMEDNDKYKQDPMGSTGSSHMSILHS